MGKRCNLNAITHASKLWGFFSTSALYRFVLTFEIVSYRLPSLFHWITLVCYCSFCLLYSSSVNMTVICMCVCGACYAASKRIFMPVRELRRRWTLVLCSLCLSTEKTSVHENKTFIVIPVFFLLKAFCKVPFIWWSNEQGPSFSALTEIPLWTKRSQPALRCLIQDCLCCLV